MEHYCDALAVVDAFVREDEEREAARKLVREAREYNADGYCINPVTGEACEDAHCI